MDEVGLAFSVSADSAPVAPEEPPPPPLAIAARFQPVLNAALLHNSVPALCELAIENTSDRDFAQVTLHLDSEPPVIAPRTWTLQHVAAGQIRTLRDLDVQLDNSFVTALTEAMPCRARLAVHEGAAVLATRCEEIRLLPANFWGGVVGLPDILAAFVEPNDPAVARIVRSASDLLRAQGRPESLEGYQSGDKARVWDQVHAIWSAICALDIRYVAAPPSFEQSGQRIRPPRQIIDEKLANCLDATLLLAACLEHVSLHPLIVLIHGHAFPGVWYTERARGRPIPEDPAGLRNAAALDDLLLFESTLATQAAHPPLRAAKDAAMAHLDPSREDVFESVIDVFQARRRRIRPLPALIGPHNLMPRAGDPDSSAAPVLEPAPPLHAEIEESPAAAEAQRLDRIGRWRQRLMDLTGRNRLLNLPAASKQVLSIACPDIARLENMLAELRGQARKPPLRFRPWPELMAGRDPRSAQIHRDRTLEDASREYCAEALQRRELVGRLDETELQATLTTIYRAARNNQQEGGANTLFLTLGSLLWKKQDREKPYRAPLILIPVVLERHSIRSGFTLRTHDDETRINSTLLEMLRQDFAVHFPSLLEWPPTDDAGLDVSAIVDMVRRKLRHIPGWEVAEDASITNLSFTKFLMWKDLSDRIDTLRQNPVVRRLIDPAEASIAEVADTQTSDGESGAGALDRELERAELVCPLEADSSQSRAAARAAAGTSFVMIGPPGTGKSQTIANIIANTLAQGRTVLFVAEKRAALEVVQRRLEQAELGYFCLDLFSSKASKFSVLQQLDRARKNLEPLQESSWQALCTQTAALRAELNAYVRALHDRAANGWTPFRAIGMALRAEDERIPRLSLGWPARDAHTAADYQVIIELVEELSAAWERTGQSVRAAALAGIEVDQWSPPWEQRLLDAARAAAATLQRLRQCAHSAGSRIGLAHDGSRDSHAALDRLCALLLGAPEADGGWALADDGQATQDALRAAADRIQRHVHLRQSLAAAWTCDSRRAGRLLRAALEAAGRAAVLLGTPQDGSRATLEMQDHACSVLLEAPRDAGWALADDAPAIHARVDAAAEAAHRHASLHQAMRGAWKPAVMALPLSELRNAWILGAAKWALPRRLALAALRKQLAPAADGPVPEDCADDLVRLAEMQTIEREFAASDLGTRLGALWRGLDTDFAAVEAGYAWALRLRAALSAGVPQHIRDLVARRPDVLGPDGEVGTVFAAFRAARHAALEACGGCLAEDCRAELQRLDELAAIETWLDASSLGEAIGSRWRGRETDFTKLQAGAAWAAQLRDAMATCVTEPAALADLRQSLRRLVTDGIDLLSPGATIARTLGDFRAAWLATQTTLDALAPLCGSVPGDRIAAGSPGWPEQLEQVFAGWAESARALREWCSWHTLSRRAAATGLETMVTALTEGLVAPRDAVRVFEANYARWWIGLAVEESPILRGFAASTHETRIERFRNLDRRMLGLASRLVRARLAAALQRGNTGPRDPEYALLNHELQKRTRHIPVRQLAQGMPRVLRRLTPCLMMSPLSVAQFLPADAEPFDLVIFDEASQIATWDAIGAVGRGRQVVVVGDPQQLPPTDFFARQDDDTDGIADPGEQDLESVLNECRSRGMPELELNWHYRSRHESLITFSNHTYYGGRLVTFPSPVAQDRAVSFRHVTEGVYGRSGSRTNPVEAQHVVAETVRRLQATIDGSRPPESIGIVTFNAQQQSLIETLLDRERECNPALEPFFSEAAEEPVLIKNLEGIQGEERDVMLFSLTFGPDAAGKVAMNFGPLNSSGGERRLNVAVTRARSELLVFGSLRAEQLDLARTNALGIRHLKQFLAYAERGAKAFAGVEEAGTGDYESPFEAAVATRLRAKGWEVRPQIGVSGFRVDLGVLDPDAAGAYLAGIECDGATYHRGATARDRDRLRQTVLEGLGWSILRIWSTDWWTNADREAERLQVSLELLLKSRRRQRQAESVPAAAVEPVAAPATGPDAEPTADPALFYEDSYRPRLQALLEATLAKWGPLREDVLAHHVARAHGFQRTGGEIRARVLAALPPGCARSRDGLETFVWPPGILPADWSSFRPPPSGGSRDPTEMPMEELVVLARQVLTDKPDEEQALLAMRDACGLQRLRERSRQRCSDALSIARESHGGGGWI